MSTPEYIALLLGAVNFLGGIVISNLRSTLSKLQQQVEDLGKAQNTQSVAIARDYVTRAEMQQTINRIMDKLDEIQRDVKGMMK